MTQDIKKLSSIEKALEIMLKFQDVKPSWGIRELSTKLKFSPATVQRILQVLKSYEFVKQDPKTRQNKLLKELDKIKKQGYGISLRERTPGIGSLSAPVFDYRRQILASLSLVIPEIRFKQEDHLSNCIDILTRAAKSFSNEMVLGTGKILTI